MQMEEIKTKICSVCNVVKDISCFDIQYNNPSHHINRCKLCSAIYRKQYRLINRVKLNNTRKNYYNDNKDSILKKAKLAWVNNKIKYKNKNSDYYIENKELFKAKNSAYYRLHKSDIISKGLVYIKQKEKTDANFKLLNRNRTRMYQFLRGINKSTNTKELLCVDADFIWQHLEKQFRDGMTRENYGRVWHIDHIIPLQFFKDNCLLDETNQKLMFHWGNLQPLLIHENNIKRDSIPQKTNFRY